MLQRTLLVASLAMLPAGTVLGQERAVIGGASVGPAFRAAESRRVDVVMIGDSNQLSQGIGWDHGWARALSQRYPIYATGLHSAGENGGNGAGVGYGSDLFSTRSSGVFAYAGAPAPLDVHLGADAGVAPLNYAYVAQGQSVPGTVNHGLRLERTSPLDVNAALRFHFSYGVFGPDAEGMFLPLIRQQEPPYTPLVLGEAVPTAGDQAGPAALSLDLPRQDRNVALNFRWARTGGEIRGPFLAYYVRAENTERPAGFAVHTLYGRGGQSARDMAGALLAWPDESLSMFFRLVRELQTEPGTVLVRINTGLNDRNETLPSVGAQITPGNSPAAYVDNVRAIVERVREIWRLNGWPMDELHFVLTPSHRVGEPEDPLLLAYRDAAEALVLQLPRFAVVRMERLATQAEMESNNWYINAWDHDHLSLAGFERLAAREIDALRACPADLNGDGALSVADFAAFRAAYLAAEPAADFDDDGRLSVGDISAYRAAYIAGCP